MQITKRLLTTCALASTLVASGAALAETITQKGPQPFDPILQMSEQEQGPNQFTLTSQQDVDLVRFKRVHLISLCVPHVNHDQVDAPAHAVGIIVRWPGGTHVIPPGACYQFRAQRVSVQPDKSLGNLVLNGNVSVMD